MQAFWRQHWYALSLGGLLLLALALRLNHLNLNLWLDEYYTAAISETIVKTGTTIFPTGFNYNRAALYSYTVAAFIKLLGNNSEVVLRLPSVLFGLGTMWFITDTVRRLATRHFALLAAAITAVFPWAITYSQFARFYAPLIFFVSVAMWASLRWQQSRGRQQWLWVGVGVIATLLAGSMNYMGLAAGLCFFPQKWLQKRPWWVIAGAMGVSLGGALAFGMWQFPTYFGVTRQYTYAIWLGMWFFPWLMVLSYGFWQALYHRRTALPIFWMFFASLGLLTLNQHDNPQPRYLTFLLPVLIVGTVVGLYWWQRQVKGKLATWGMVMMVAILLGQQSPWLWQLVTRDYGSPVTGPNQISTSLDYFPDLKSPVLYVREHAQPGDIIIAIKPRTETEYYLGKSPDYLLRSGRLWDVGEKYSNGYLIDSYLGVPLIENRNQLEEVLHNSSKVWLIASPSLQPSLSHVSIELNEEVQRIPIQYSGKTLYSKVFINE